MRITNQMVSGNSLRNLQKSMRSADEKTQQMTSGKKIQQASEDPVIAIRALKLRTTVNQLEQYKGKNIPDANSWYQLTTTSLDNITERLKNLESYCVQGANDTFNSENRSDIIDVLKQFKDAVSSEGNSTYAGRYIFSGYKTDRSLAFTETEDTSIYSYDIKQHIKASDLTTKNVVLNSIKFDDADDAIANGTFDKIEKRMVYRMNLAYEGVDDTNFSIKLLDDEGNVTETLSGITVKETSDADTYYDVDDDGINLIKETGEIIFGKNVYNKLKVAPDIEVDYSKSKFDAGDLRPEHYYECTGHVTQEDGSVKDIEYTQPEEGQRIFYEVNFNQSIQVNTEGNKLINAELANNVNDLIYSLKELQDAEENRDRIKGMLNDVQYANDEDAGKMINKLLADIDVEVAVKRENMQKTFSANITNIQQYIKETSAMQSDVGSRMTKLEMIETRVREQYATFKELKSQNEDVESEVAITEFNEANLVYNSALAATGNVLKQTLLDYI